jgi:hypothetical protein
MFGRRNLIRAPNNEDDTAVESVLAVPSIID